MLAAARAQWRRQQLALHVEPDGPPGQPGSRRQFIDSHAVAHATIIRHLVSRFKWQNAGCNKAFDAAKRDLWAQPERACKRISRDTGAGTTAVETGKLLGNAIRVAR